MQCFGQRFVQGGDGGMDINVVHMWFHQLHYHPGKFYRLTARI